MKCSSFWTDPTPGFRPQRGHDTPRRVRPPSPGRLCAPALNGDAGKLLVGSAPAVAPTWGGRSRRTRAPWQTIPSLASLYELNAEPSTTDALNLRALMAVGSSQERLEFLG